MQVEEIESGGRYRVPAVERAMAVFELLTEHVEGLSQTDIADLLRVPRNSIFRITSYNFV